MTTETKSLEQLFDEQNQLLREQNDLLRGVANSLPKKKRWVCGSWPNCYHGALIGGIFGCGDSR